jgi:hypothetical protein
MQSTATARILSSYIDCLMSLGTVDALILEALDIGVITTLVKHQSGWTFLTTAKSALASLEQRHYYL